MKLLFITLFLLSTQTAQAQGLFAKEDWVQVLSGQFAKYFVDRNSIKSAGDIVGFRFLMDLPKPDDGALSYVQDAEIDCKRFLFRTTSLYTYSEHKAKGRKLIGAVFTPEQSEFYNPEPMMNIDYYNMVKKLCS